jgi:hypothetical protein
MAKILNFPRLARVIELFSWSKEPARELPFSPHDEQEFIVRRCREIEEREQRIREEKDKVFRLRALNGGEGIR